MTQRPQKGQKITLMFQGRVDGSVEAFEVDGMLVIPAEDGVAYVTRRQACEFFGLVEPGPRSCLTCKHRAGPVSETPCHGCGPHVAWEPAEPEVDARFAAAHYQDGRDLVAVPSPAPAGWWTEELERIFTATPGTRITAEMKRAAAIAHAIGTVRVARGERWDDAKQDWAPAPGVPRIDGGRDA